MNKSAEQLLQAKLEDLLRLGERRPAFLGFLDESEAAQARQYYAFRRDKVMFWGGFSQAERVIAGVFPDYLEPDASLFPLQALTFRFREEDALSHRDFLGALMSLGVERSMIGDILVEKGRAVLFVREEMTGYFLQNIRKIGRVGVKILEGAEEPFPEAHQFQNVSGVIASERLDCFTALLCKTSREKAAGFIVQGLVMINHVVQDSVSVRVQEGDILSIRGKGKFIVDQVGPETAKGRLSVQCRKYI